MSPRQVVEQTILNAVTPVAITSSTNATPSVVTATAHGLATGDKVFIFNHAVNTAINGIYEVVFVSANTFSMIDIYTRAAVAGNGVGAGTGYCMKAPSVVRARDFNKIEFFVGTTGTSTLTLTPWVSQGKFFEDSGTASATVTNGPRYDEPVFGATISKTNPYEAVAFTDLLTQTKINGSTGIALAAADINKNYEVLYGGVRYFTVVPTAWTQGAISIKFVGYYY